MDYKLAKELKDAGFPNLNWMDYLTPTGMETFGTQIGPTLSELIEACVTLSHDGDFHLEHLMQGGSEDWGAAVCWMPVEKSEWSKGATPEEAVANLWLALHLRASSSEHQTNPTN